MIDSIQVAIGVVDGKVIAQWHEAITSIAFDPKNAYLIGTQLAKAAMEAHRGSATEGDIEFIMDELRQVKIEVNDMQRAAMIASVATILRTLFDRGPDYCAPHCVDAVLRETAR